MNKNQLLLIFFSAAIVLLVSFCFTGQTSAGYYTLSTLVSTNLLQDVSAAPTSIDSFVYNLSAKPSGTTATVAFNQDGGSTWYDATGNVGTETLVTGTNQTINLTSGWSGANFYYKLTFTSDGTNTAVLDDITLHYTIAGRPATRAFARPLSYREQTDEEQLEEILKKIIETLEQLIQIYTQLIQMLKEGQSLNLLNPHSSPEAGEQWVISFETIGSADLIITPQDQDTVNDLDFVSLTCDDEEKIESLQVLEGDTISCLNWQCQGQGELTYLVNLAGEHTLEFQFGDDIAYAYNNPDSVTDTFTDTSKVATTSNMTVNTTLGQVYSSTCEDNGTACSGAGECCSGYCVDGVCCDSACDGICQACVVSKTGGSDGTCANMTNNTDPDSECAGTCKVCQSGSCGNATAGTDPEEQCTTASPPAADSCKSATCSGADYGCGYLAAGEQSQPACKRCNGSSYDPVNITDDTGDSEGSNLCDATSGDCYRCLSGSCTYQTAAQDLFNECPGSLGTCAATTCSGSDYSCEYLTVGQQGCDACKYCTGSDYTCLNVAADTDPYSACTGDCDECDGSGACRGDDTICDGTVGSCYCSGSGTSYSCQSCADPGVCQYPTCSSYTCGSANEATDYQETGCNGCNWCNGSGTCVNCSWTYVALQSFCLGTEAPQKYCKPSTSGTTGYDHSDCTVAWTANLGGGSTDKCARDTCTCE